MVEFLKFLSMWPTSILLQNKKLVHVHWLIKNLLGSEHWAGGDREWSPCRPLWDSGFEKEGSTDPTDQTPAWEPPSHEWKQDARVMWQKSDLPVPLMLQDACDRLGSWALQATDTDWGQGGIPRQRFYWGLMLKHRGDSTKEGVLHVGSLHKGRGKEWHLSL